MNAQDTAPRPTSLVASPAFANAPRLASLLRRLCVLHLVLFAATLAPAVVLRLHPHPAIPANEPTILLVRAALMISLTGLMTTALIATARARTLSCFGHEAATPGAASPIVRAARSPQALLLCAGAVSALFTLRMAWIMPQLSGTASSTAFLPVALLLAAFLLLISERSVGSLDQASLPEAPGLSAMMRLPVIVLGALALLCILGTRAPLIGHLAWLAVILLIAASALEMALRTLGVWYAPPPTVHGARAAVGSLVVNALDPRRLSPAALGASLNRNFGIDFARSWALAFARRALLPVMALLLCVCWGLSGASRVGLDQRAVYERFGAPVALLGPGLHLLLPWPLGRARLSEYGIVHSIVLSDGAGMAAAMPDLSHAEDVAPVSANRLWDQAEDDSSYLVARADGGRQSFEAMSVNLRVLYRVGLSAEAARDALYRTTDPALLIRVLARRLLSRTLAAQTLSEIMVERHDQLAVTLRSGLQAQLDGMRSGIEIVGLVIESLHPPAGAASAYRAVQAALIAGGTAIAQEQGRARGTASIALRDANDIRDGALAQAAETLQAATAEQIRMAADDGAWHAGGEAFLMERRFANLRTGLGHAPLEIIDSRLPARMLDLRAGAAAAGGRDLPPDENPDNTTDPNQTGPNQTGPNQESRSQ